MADRGRKNPAGGWLQQQINKRALFAMLVLGTAVGVALGLLILVIPAVASSIPTLPWWYFFLGACCIMGSSWGMLMMLLRRTESTWLRGLVAEKRVADYIDHALVRSGCAFAHDVKEALADGRGNVDHIVLTPVSVWVVETKAAWLDPEPFEEALRQTGANVARVRQKLDTTFPVRGALVIADDHQGRYEKECDRKGERITAFRVESFRRRLLQECNVEDPDIEVREQMRLARRIWDLGAVEHLDA